MRGSSPPLPLLYCYRGHHDQAQEWLGPCSQVDAGACKGEGTVTETWRASCKAAATVQQPVFI